MEIIFHICFLAVVSDSMAASTVSNTINKEEIDMILPEFNGEARYYEKQLGINPLYLGLSKKEFLKSKLPKVIVKRNAPLQENEKKTPFDKFLYDDDEENNNSNSKFDFETNPDSTESMQNQASIDNINENVMEEKVQERSIKANKESKVNPKIQERNVLPDVVIDQIVYEESETKVESLKSGMESLEKLVKSRNEKDKHTFSKIFSDIKNLFSEIEQLKKMQNELNKVTDNSRRREILPKTSRAAFTPPPIGCPKLYDFRIPNPNIYSNTLMPHMNRFYGSRRPKHPMNRPITTFIVSPRIIGPQLPTQYSKDFNFATYPYLFDVPTF